MPHMRLITLSRGRSEPGVSWCVELAQIVQQRSHPELVHFRGFHAQSLAQQEADHHDIDGVQRAALAHAF